MRSSTIYLGGKGEGKYRATHAYCAVINVPSRVELSRVELSRVELLYRFEPRHLNWVGWVGAAALRLAGQQKDGGAGRRQEGFLRTHITWEINTKTFLTRRFVDRNVSIFHITLEYRYQPFKKNAPTQQGYSYL